MMAAVVYQLTQVTVCLRGIPTHTWNVTMAQKLLSLACSGLQPTSETVAKTDLCHYFVVTWCIHLDHIPREKIIFILELKVVVDVSYAAPQAH
jgi:hypothetical protein